jgi:hypothetical protein
MAHENAKSVIKAYKLSKKKPLQLKVVLFYYLINHQHIYNQPKEFPMEQKRKWLNVYKLTLEKWLQQEQFCFVIKCITNANTSNQNSSHWNAKK